MVHQYKNNGYNMALDVASGSVHVVDDLTYEVIALYEDQFCVLGQHHAGNCSAIRNAAGANHAPT